MDGRRCWVYYLLRLLNMCEGDPPTPIGNLSTLSSFIKGLGQAEMMHLLGAFTYEQVL